MHRRSLSICGANSKKLFPITIDFIIGLGESMCTRANLIICNGFNVSMCTVCECRHQSASQQCNLYRRMVEKKTKIKINENATSHEFRLIVLPFFRWNFIFQFSFGWEIELQVKLQRMLYDPAGWAEKRLNRITGFRRTIVASKMLWKLRYTQQK